MTRLSRVSQASTTGQRQSCLALVLVDLQRCAPALLALEGNTSRLPSEQAAEVAALRVYDARKKRHIAHIALRLLLENYVAAASLRGIAFVLGKHGRPCLADSDVAFSLSYSGDQALIAIADAVAGAGSVGIDFETWRQIRMPLARRRRIEAAAVVLTSNCGSNGTMALAAEQGAYERQDKVKQLGEDAAFLQAWTRLEAVAKASGLGIATILDRFDLLGAGKTWTKQSAVMVEQLLAEECLWVQDLAMGEGKFAAIALSRSVLAGAAATLWPVKELPQELAALEDLASGRLALGDLPSVSCRQAGQK